MDSGGTLGLTSAEAELRLNADGPNELPQTGFRSGLRILRDVLREPMLSLLIAGASIYAFLGEMSDAIVLGAFACLSIVITLVQELRSERVLEALRDLSSPRALVVRDGENKRIPGRDVVRGDVMLLAEGDRVPADAILIRSHDLLADESLLTGESMPVRKMAIHGAADPESSPGEDRPNSVFSGSLIVRGTGTAEVTATGLETEIGKIGKSLTTLKTEQPRLYAQTRRIVLFFAASGALVSLLLFVLYGTMHGDWLQALLASIALGMSMLPEEFPVVLAIFTAMGAWRMSKARVLTRRAAAIETLGSATVLCTDKTGTLTENRMHIREVRLSDGSVLKVDEITGQDGKFTDIFLHGLLACAPNAFDPMERAFHDYCTPERTGLDPDHPPQFLRAYGLRPDLLAMSQVWQDPADPGKVITASKGAPEAIADLCRLSPKERAAQSEAIDQMAARGLRVLAVAKGVGQPFDLPNSQHELALEYVGIVGLADPLRRGAAEAVAECLRAGIRVKMITGDYPVTAATIAREAGLDARLPVSGVELDQLDDPALAGRLEEADVFSRVMPEQKLRIVNVLKSAGEVVAMTGDGVNDAPSLKSAHIGIAMGGRGTDVAREAASLVLLDDDFGSIVKAIRLGRRIYDNLRKAVSFIFAVHVPIAGLAIVPLLFGLPIILGPIHIAFIEMVIDPVCTLVFEAEEEEADIMDRPPRPPGEKLFSPELVGWSLTQGAVAFAAVALVLLQGVRMELPDEELRAISFFALVTVIVALIFVNRSFSPSIALAFKRPKPTLLVVLAAVSGILLAAVIWPFARDVFSFGPLHVDDLIRTGATGLAVLVLLEIIKPFWRRSVDLPGQ